MFSAAAFGYYLTASVLSMTVSAAALAIVGFVVNHTTCFDPEANHYEFTCTS